MDTVEGYSWTSYHKRTREILRAEYGLTGVSRDKYREQFFIGNSPAQAAEQISLRTGGLRNPMEDDVQ